MPLTVLFFWPVHCYCNGMTRLSHKMHGDDADYVTPSQ
jgi:hypothetical protein